MGHYFLDTQYNHAMYIDHNVHDTHDIVFWSNTQYFFYFAGARGGDVQYRALRDQPHPSDRINLHAPDNNLVVLPNSDKTRVSQLNG